MFYLCRRFRQKIQVPDSMCSLYKPTCVIRVPVLSDVALSMCFVCCVIRHPVYSETNFLSQCMSDKTGFTIIEFTIVITSSNYIIIITFFQTGPTELPQGMFFLNG